MRITLFLSSLMLLGAVAKQANAEFYDPYQFYQQPFQQVFVLQIYDVNAINNVFYQDNLRKAYIYEQNQFIYQRNVNAFNFAQANGLPTPVYEAFYDYNTPIAPSILAPLPVPAAKVAPPMLKSAQTLLDEQTKREMTAQFGLDQNKNQRYIQLPLTETSIQLLPILRIARSSVDEIIEALKSPPYNLRVVKVNLQVNRLLPSQQKLERHHFENSIEDVPLASNLSRLESIQNGDITMVYVPANGGEGALKQSGPMIILKDYVSKDLLIYALLLHHVYTSSKYFERYPFDTDNDAVARLANRTKDVLAVIDANWFLVRWNDLLGNIVDKNRRNTDSTITHTDLWRAIEKNNEWKNSSRYRDFFLDVLNLRLRAAAVMFLAE